MKKTAVVLFNLGGPDRKESVRPFLFNLFCDRAIIRLPQPFRFLIALYLSLKRTPVAENIYEKIGGGSPILQNTKNQAAALEKILSESQDGQFKVFVSMRYWHPLAASVVKAVKEFAPNEIILLPLYPQFSTTTTQSSLGDWQENALKSKLKAPFKVICCYPHQSGFIRALAGLTRKAYMEAKNYGVPRILFSAHGLPEKIIRCGDPYETQCRLTVQSLEKELGIENLDAVLCFQSRVGPLKWIGPSTDDEIRRAGHDKVPLVIAPISFVSDHSETLVEIDIEYRHLAKQKGVPFFASVKAVGTEPDFIEGLATLVRKALASEKDCIRISDAQACGSKITSCPLNGFYA